jgi:hypothetical protein
MRAPGVLFHAGPHRFAPAREQRADGAGPAAQGAGDRRVRQVVDVAQGQRRALARRQAIEQRESAGQLVIVARWRVVTRVLGLAPTAGRALRRGCAPGCEQGSEGGRAAG